MDAWIADGAGEVSYSKNMRLEGGINPGGEQLEPTVPIDCTKR